MEFISLMELMGTVAFAVSGALVAIKNELDYYGICILAIITAVGGGLVRDVIINVGLPACLDNPIYVIISIISAVIVILFYKKTIKFHNIITFFDAIGLAAFTAIGCEVAVSSGYATPWIVITLALLTGTGGGVFRDVFVKDIPFVFRKEIYAVASILGSIVFLIALMFLKEQWAIYIAFAVTFIIRLVSMKLDIHLGKAKKA